MKYANSKDEIWRKIILSVSKIAYDLLDSVYACNSYFFAMHRLLMLLNRYVSVSLNGSGKVKSDKDTC